MSESIAPPTAPRPARTEVLLEELRQFPVQHLVAARLLTMLDEGPSAEQLGHVIAADPALSTQVIRLANSAYYGLRTPVGSAARATVVLGFSAVRSLAVSAALGVFEERGRAAPDGFWTHAVRTAAAAATVARRLGASPGEAFSAGMLHDVGAALLFRRAPLRYDATLARAQLDGTALLEVEEEELGASHPLVGATVLEAWRFPPTFVDAVRDHHDPPGPSMAPLTLAVIAGEALACALDPIDVCSPEPVAFVDDALAAAGLAELPREELLEAVRAEVDALAGFLTMD